MRRIQLLSALALAVSFVLPVSKCTSPGDETTFGYFWQSEDWLVTLAIFAPLALATLRLLRWSRRHPLAHDLATLLAAGLLAVPLAAFIQAETMFGGRLAYGAYVAQAALACFLVTTAALVWAGYRAKRVTIPP